MTLSRTPSRASSIAWAWRSWCGANRRRTPACAASRRSSERTAAFDQGRPRVGPSMMQNSGRTGSSTRAASQGESCSHPQASRPIPRRRPPFPWRTSNDPRSGRGPRSPRASASWTRSPARQSTTIRPRTRQPWRSSAGSRITRTISSTVGGSAGLTRLELVPFRRLVGVGADDRLQSKGAARRTIPCSRSSAELHGKQKRPARAGGRSAATSGHSQDDLPDDAVAAHAVSGFLRLSKVSTVSMTGRTWPSAPAGRTSEAAAMTRPSLVCLPAPGRRFERRPVRPAVRTAGWRCTARR
jgi:hypothetical protein